MTENMTPRRRRFAVAVGPHKQVSEVFTLDVPAQRGVIAHRDYLVLTACGREVATTLATQQDGKVRCPDCLAATKGN